MWEIRRHLSHWVTVAVLIAIGVFVGEWLGSHGYWITLRYRLYQSAQRFNPRDVYPKRTIIVLVDDEDYWKGDLAYRVPIKRDYLARLVRALDKAGPEVIALDFDLRSRNPDGSLPEHPDYVAETREFLNAVKEVSQNRTIVLARTVGLGKTGVLMLESAIYDHFDMQGGDVRSGYIEMPYDLRQVPMPLTMGDGKSLDSFSVAIVRPLDRRAIRVAQGNGSLPYGTLIEQQRFPSISAGKVLQSTNPSYLRSLFRNKVAIVGGSWSRLAYKRGGLIDSDETPIGRVGGVFMHANYAEALLDQRTYSPLNRRVAMWIEILLSVVVAVAFSIKMRPWVKVLSVGALLVGIIPVTYIFWQNLGLFFDFFIPLVLLAGHALIEQISKWREASTSSDIEWEGAAVSLNS